MERGWASNYKRSLPGFRGVDPAVGRELGGGLVTPKGDPTLQKPPISIRSLSDHAKPKFASLVSPQHCGRHT